MVSSKRKCFIPIIFTGESLCHLKLLGGIHCIKCIECITGIRYGGRILYKGRVLLVGGSPGVLMLGADMDFLNVWRSSVISETKLNAQQVC